MKKIEDHGYNQNHGGKTGMLLHSTETTLLPQQPVEFTQSKAHSNALGKEIFA